MGDRGTKPPGRHGTGGNNSQPRTSAPTVPTAHAERMDRPHCATGPEEQGRQLDHPIVAAFHELRDELVSTLLYLLGNRDDAFDAVQDAFLKCWRARETVAGVSNLRAWIFRVGLNTAKDMQRSAWARRVKPLIAEEMMLAAPETTPGYSIDDREALDRLRAAIADLRQDEQEVFLLRQNGDLTYEQIAEIRQAPIGTVKTQMRTALLKLRQALNPDGEPR